MFMSFTKKLKIKIVVFKKVIEKKTKNFLFALLCSPYKIGSCSAAYVVYVYYRNFGFVSPLELFSLIPVLKFASFFFGFGIFFLVYNQYTILIGKLDERQRVYCILIYCIVTVAFSWATDLWLRSYWVFFMCLSMLAIKHFSKQASAHTLGKETFLQKFRKDRAVQGEHLKKDFPIFFYLEDNFFFVFLAGLAIVLLPLLQDMLFSNRNFFILFYFMFFGCWFWFLLVRIYIIAFCNTPTVFKLISTLFEGGRYVVGGTIAGGFVLYNHPDPISGLSAPQLASQHYLGGMPLSAIQDVLIKQKVETLLVYFNDPMLNHHCLRRLDNPAVLNLAMIDAVLMAAALPNANRDHLLAMLLADCASSSEVRFSDFTGVTNADITRDKIQKKFIILRDGFDALSPESRKMVTEWLKKHRVN